MHFKSEASSIVKQMQETNKAGLPTLEIQHFAVAGAGLARVVAKVIHTEQSRANPELVRQAFANKFDGNMVAVAGSVRQLDRGPLTSTISGVLSVQRETVAVASDADMKPFRALASNMYLDDEDRMWSLNKTAAGNLMVRSTGIDDDHALIGMLQAVATAAPTTQESVRLRAVASSVAENLQPGDYASFVNANNAMDHGYIVAMAGDGTALVKTQHGPEDGEIINVAAVVETHELPEDVLPELSQDEQMEVAVAAARGTVSIDQMLDYYRRVFIRSSDYFEKFADRLRNHAFC